MGFHKEVQCSRSIMGRLASGKDLLLELTKKAQLEDIKLGRVEALGALKRARLGFYNQESREYEYHEVEEPLEITNLIGNISLKDGEPIIHAHVTLTNSRGEATGGHLCEGTIIFACEFFMQELTGAELTRGLDAETGLPLWKKE